MIEAGRYSEEIVFHPLGFALKFVDQEDFSISDAVPVVHNGNVGYLIEDLDASELEIRAVFEGEVTPAPEFKADTRIRIQEGDDGRDVVVFKQSIQTEDVEAITSVFFDLYPGIVVMRVALSSELLNARRDLERSRETMRDAFE